MSEEQITNTTPYAHTGVFDLSHMVNKYHLLPEQVAYVQKLIIDPVQQNDIRNCPQRTPAWLQAREGRITASKFGGARNHCKYTTSVQVVKDMLWSTFRGNAATEYGTIHEDDGERAYVRYMRHAHNLKAEQFEVSHTGLIVPVKYPWTGISVDGFVFDDSMPAGLKRGGLEIKCPFSKKLYPFIPSQYYDQIMGAMGFLELPWWDFVVWTPETVQIRRFMFDPVYWETQLYPKLEAFYFQQFLPSAVLKAQGKLITGSLHVPVVIDLGGEVDGWPDEKEKIEEPKKKPGLPFLLGKTQVMAAGIQLPFLLGKTPVSKKSRKE